MNHAARQRRTLAATLVALVALSVALAGCSRPSESTGPHLGPLDTKAPTVVVTENQPWTFTSTGGGGQLKIVRLNVTANGATTLRWQDVKLFTQAGNLTPSSAYVRLANGTAFGWSANRTLAANESVTVELHYRANQTTEEPTAGSIDGPGWKAPFALPPAAVPTRT